ncbi:MAG: NOL1/NOP2/sun family putative RNA methylase [candidate division WOR-3 bacterium]
MNFQEIYNTLFEIFYDKEDFEKFVEILKKEIPTCIRVNFIKIEKKELLKILKEKGFEIKKNDIIPYALEVLKEPFEISKTIEHYLGFFYIQSLSSMIPVEILNIKEEEKILDICAAPGSKTTQAGISLKNKGVIVANDINIDRLKALSHNIDRIGLLNVVITKIQGEKIGDIFFEEFDKVIVDPPCSSLGMLEKYPDILKWWHPREIDKFYRIQREIFKSAIKALKPEGKVVYSTCTLSIKENEYLIDEMVKNYPLEIVEIKNEKIPSRKGFKKFKDILFLDDIEKTIRIYPQDILSEGFYIALLRKKDTIKREKKFYLKDDRKLLDIDDREIKEIFLFLEDEFGLLRENFEDFLFYIKKDEIWILSKKIKEIINPFDLRRGMRFLRKYSKGYKLTTNFVQVFGKLIKNRRLEIENFEDARNFLLGKDIKISSKIKGQVVIFYKDFPLGVGVIQNDVLKSQVPKSRRIFEIKG